VATLQDVAREADVSISTASRALSGGKGADRLSDDCVARVQEAAREVGYRVNYHARSLQTGRANALGMVLRGPGTSDPVGGFMTAVLGCVDVEARAAGQHFVTIGPAGPLSEMENGLRFLEEGRIDGLIVQGGMCSEESLEKLQGHPGPIVVLDPDSTTKLPGVILDDAAGIRRAVRHLAKLGHREIIWVGLEQAETRSRSVRQEAFWSTVEELDLVGEDLLVPAPAGRWGKIGDEIACARRAVLDRLERGTGATAMVCYHDLIALAACAALSERGRRVPEQMSVVGFDDVFGELCWPPLTCVSHMLQEMAHRAVGLLLNMAESEQSWKDMRKHREVVQPDLVVRESTGPAPTE
jgi:DNA-binding LacI/PurR family transcriptional regulator